MTPPVPLTFIWPDALWLLLLLPVVVVLYLLFLRRGKKAAARYPALEMLRASAAAGTRIRRHVPPLLFLVALGLMIAAVARPVATVTLPAQKRTIILAMDVSGSMRAKDVEPNRISAAKEAAKAFLADLPREVRVGIVSFAATASVVQPPTTDRDDLLAAIERFQLQRGTAVGSAIMVSLATLLPDAGIDLSQLTLGSRPGGRRAPPPDGDKEKAFKPVPPGSYTEGAIILLTDGQRTSGPDTRDAAKLAADRGVRVYTVGVGTEKGEVLAVEGWSMRVRLDEAALKEVANITQGEYFAAGTASELTKVYEDLSARLVFERKEMEVTALFAAAAAAIALVAGFFSVAWFGRIL